jgi:hypothetical protein
MPDKDLGRHSSFKQIYREKVARIKPSKEDK